MKRYIALLVMTIAVTFALAACGGNETPDENTGNAVTSDNQSKTQEQSEADTSKESDAASETAGGNEDSTKDYREDIKKETGAEAVYRDALNTIDYFAICSDKVMKITKVDGISRAVTINRSEIARLEDTGIGSFFVLNIYDKTGEKMTIQLKSDEIQEVRKILK